jgi:hypothetical protein
MNGYNRIVNSDEINVESWKVANAINSLIGLLSNSDRLGSYEVGEIKRVIELLTSSDEELDNV